MGVENAIRPTLHRALALPLGDGAKTHHKLFLLAASPAPPHAVSKNRQSAIAEPVPEGVGRRTIGAPGDAEGRVQLSAACGYPVTGGDQDGAVGDVAGLRPFPQLRAAPRDAGNHSHDSLPLERGSKFRSREILNASCRRSPRWPS